MFVLQMDRRTAYAPPRFTPTTSQEATIYESQNVEEIVKNCVPVITESPPDHWLTDEALRNYIPIYWKCISCGEWTRFERSWPDLVWLGSFVEDVVYEHKIDALESFVRAHAAYWIDKRPGAAKTLRHLAIYTDDCGCKAFVAAFHLDDLMVREGQL